MGLFDAFKKKPDTTVKQEPVKAVKQVSDPVLNEFTYTSTKGYKGYKRTYMGSLGKVSGSDQLDNIAVLVKKHGDDLSKLPVVFQVRKSAKTGKMYVSVFVEGLDVGSYNENERYLEYIVSGKVNAVYVRHDVEEIVEDIAKSDKIVKRDKLKLFISIPE